MNTYKCDNINTNERNLHKTTAAVHGASVSHYVPKIITIT